MGRRVVVRRIAVVGIPLSDPLLSQVQKGAKSAPGVHLKAKSAPGVHREVIWECCPGVFSASVPRALWRRSCRECTGEQISVREVMGIDGTGKTPSVIPWD